MLLTVDRALDLSWRLATDPIGLFEDISKGLSESFESQLKFFSAILGACLVFFGLNLMVFSSTKFSELCEYVRKIIKALIKLPLMSFLFAVVKKLFHWALTVAEVTKPQDLVDMVDRKVDVLTETMRKIVDIIEEPNVHNTSGRKVRVEGDCRLKKADVRFELSKRNLEESSENADPQDNICLNSSTGDK